MKDPNVLETFQATIDGKYAPLSIMNNEDTDMDSKITTFNTAVTETAGEILGKHRQNFFFQIPGSFSRTDQEFLQ